MADSQTSLNTCSCPCSPVILSSLTRLPVMSNIFASGDTYSVGSQSSYMHGAADSSFFCSHLGAPGNNIRDSSDTWGPVTRSPIYDHATATFYPYRHSYGGLDLNGRRKNATRESTNTLKAWLHEHLKNPYPTKGEKIMLAIITKMTLTQVSTWFANARRRLKKENRISGSPRHKSDNGQDGGLDDIFVSGDEEKNTKNNKEHSVGMMDTTRTNHNYHAAPSEPPPRLPKSSNSQLPANTRNIRPTPAANPQTYIPAANTQTYIPAGQSQEELDSGKRKIWSVIEFLNTTSPGDKGVLELDLDKSDKSISGDVFYQPSTHPKSGNLPARRDNHSSNHEDSSDNQSSSIDATSYDNQPSKRQPSSSILRPYLSTHETALGYLQDNVYARSQHLIERL